MLDTNRIANKSKGEPERTEETNVEKGRTRESKEASESIRHQEKKEKETGRKDD